MVGEGFNDDRHIRLKVYENVRNVRAGCSTTGFWDGPPTVSAAALATAIANASGH